MYSILLVEDERIELDTLKNYVDWKGMGIDSVFTARGARSALECVNSEEPDIVITDIHMPGMSGIELVEILRQEGHRCKVIFLTGYDRFEYAKEAIRLQVEDFLLKPFQVEEVEAAVQKLLARIKEEEKDRTMNRLAVGKLLEQICMGDASELDQMSDLCFQKPAEQVFLHAAALRGISQETRQRLESGSEVLHAFSADQLFILLLPEFLTPELFLTRSEKLLQKEPWQIICTDEKIPLTGLHKAYEQLLLCEHDLFYGETRTVMKCSSHRERKPYEDRILDTPRKKVVLEAILAGQTEKAKEYLMDCLKRFTDLDRDGFCKNAFSLFLYLHRQLDTIGGLDGPAAVPVILQAERMDDVIRHFSRYVEQCCEACISRNESRWSSYVYEFVRQRYMKDCTVEEMAEGINVSPNYLRRKFKEEAGMTILEYITETRLKTAAEMLADSSLKIKDISLAVGYPNISYFTQLFSRRYGVTPNEYKKNL